MKLTFIGAGSLVFTKRILSDVITFPALRENLTICLEDIDPHRLDLIKRYFDKIKRDNPELMKNVVIEATTDQREALTDTRYVVCAIQVGGLEAYKWDLNIPWKFGVRQVVGDSLGPGGVFRFLRSAPVYQSILKDMQEVGEHFHGRPPVLLNYTNPMAMNTWYCNTIFPDSTYGLCHGVQGTSNQLRRWIGAEKENFKFTCVGINHMAWFLNVEYLDTSEPKSEWRDGYPKINQHVDKHWSLFFSEKVRSDMMRATGYYMTESSGHLAEYLPYYLKRFDLLTKYRQYPTKAGFSGLSQGIYYRSGLINARLMNKRFAREFRKAEIKVQEKPSDEYGSHILNALETGQDFWFNGNLINKNQEYITNPPNGCCVEVPIKVNSEGFHPMEGFTLPEVCQGLNMSNIMVQQAAVMGVLRNDRELIYHAVMLDPNTNSVCSPREIRKMVDKMFEKEKKWISAALFS